MIMMFYNVMMSLQFNPDKYPYATLKPLNNFIEQFEFRYNIQNSKSSRNTVENEILE